MAEITVSVKIKGGKRTPVTVSAWLPGNPHSIEFANGNTINSEQVVRWIERELLKACQRIATDE